MSVANPAVDAPPSAAIDWRIAAACAATVAAMIIVIVWGSMWALNFVHVMAGVLWTGIDLFMGFVMGPALRAAPFEARRAVTVRIVPKTLFLMPTLAIVTGTSGWYLAQRLGFLEAPWPQFGWVAGALALIALLTVQGLGLLLPTNLRVYWELRRPTTDHERVRKLMGRYIYWVGAQGLLQVGMVLVMARFATGL